MATAKKTKKVKVSKSSKLGKKRADNQLRIANLQSVAKREDQESFERTLWLVWKGQRVPLKDAYRAVTGSTASNDELDSTKIKEFFARRGITVRAKRA